MKKAAQPITIALAGNPNAGKTTAFNHYTGARQHVANYPGITVERKTGSLTLDGEEIDLIDLPGTYSLTAYSMEEVVARRVLTRERPDAVIDLVNASALERNLYLAVQIMEMGLPVVIALNMIDESRQAGLSIDHERLSALLGVPVLPTVAKTGDGLQDVMRAAVAAGKARRDLRNETGAQYADPLFISYGPDLDETLLQMSKVIEEANFLTERFPARWVGLKYLENDAHLMRRGRMVNQEIADKLEDMARKVTAHLESTLQTYPEALIADYRYGFISGLTRQGVLRRDEDRQARMDRSDRIDKVLTHPLCGPLILIGLLYLMYQVTFTLGEYPANWLGSFFGWLEGVADAALPDGLVKSLIVSGIINGVGGVLGFVPLILFMFLQISVLEDSGYMARVAYMLDRVFRVFGLHGCSVMPFIISGGIAGGCAVPGVMATRTLRSPKERLATMLTLPFMACGAKLPVFLMLVAAFFQSHEALVMVGISLFGWAAALLVARLLRSTIIKGASTPFVMELPPYRLPTLAGVLIHTWERAWQYVKKAGTVILAVSILIWASMTFPRPAEETLAQMEQHVESVEARLAALPEEAEDERAGLEDGLASFKNEAASDALAQSWAGRLGRAMEPVSQYAGFDWKTNISLVGGFAAKEVIIATLGTAYSLGESDDEDEASAMLSERLKNDPAWNPAVALAMLVFVMLYAPCFVTLVVIKQESGRVGWALFSMLFNTVLAYGVAVAVYQTAIRLIGS